MLELGVCYYPEQWDQTIWREDAKEMSAMGLDWVRIGEFAWSMIEKSEGEFDWGWLDAAIDILGSEGLKVMLCTPTAAPPKWLVDKYPEILPVDINGRVRKFGSRRHYCFSSKTYLHHSCRITREFAKRYGGNPLIRAWQIDNEYGDHDTVRSYSESAAAGFRDWLEERYGGIDQLNKAWGTSFWSMRYNSFQEIDLPIGQIEEPNPSHAFDFAVYSSDMVRKFNSAQLEALREHVTDVPVSHNFMANSFDFDHVKVAADLDFVSWDSYPLGNLMQSSLTDEQKDHWFRTGDPDYQSYYCDLYRFLGRGKVWIAEQQPGPVNWAKNNQSPDDGMIRLWTWMAYAHGVDTVCYFRWRQARFAQEQFHAALQLPDGTPDRAALEIEQIVRERNILPDSRRSKARVAMVLDYKSGWAQEVLPQSDVYSGHDISFSWYRACREMGVDVDFLSADSDMSGYKLILIPDLIIVPDEFADQIINCNAKVLAGPRTGSKTDSMQIPEKLPPDALQSLIDVRVVRVESFPIWYHETIKFKGKSYPVATWRESIETSDAVIGVFEGEYRNGWPAIVESERCRYLCTLSSEEFVRDFVKDTLAWAGIETQKSNLNLRITYRGELGFAFNFGSSSEELPTDNRDYLIGGSTIQARDLAVWKISDAG